MIPKYWWLVGKYSHHVAVVIERERRHMPLSVWEERLLQDHAAIIDAHLFIQKNRQYIDSPDLDL